MNAEDAITMHLLIDETDHILLPRADRIHGLTDTPNMQNWRQGNVRIGYRNSQNTRNFHLEMSTEDALFLLNALEAWSLSSGFESHRKPPQNK